MTREQIAISCGLCTCDEAFTKRGLVAPDCPWHSMAVEEAMKMYGNVKLDEAKYAVSLRETLVYTTPDIETGFCQGIEAAMESIINLKDEV